MEVERSRSPHHLTLILVLILIPPFPSQVATEESLSLFCFLFCKEMWRGEGVPGCSHFEVSLPKKAFTSREGKFLVVTMFV